ncbi:Alkaline phosphatase synthesis sensor protein PhoR [Polystyrenella longa]|uniref:histidine kinase n=1 Tax=Polystyrenella longa TaxID=2528007 RepID=A0A518CRQ5_9PLAN|nr:ATP-binding protein [Polystyrenella longa]QDU81893.1 Alkaline phosphatase synthesis sensor protein PhoR [Polystyrenella longa]
MSAILHNLTTKQRLILCYVLSCALIWGILQWGSSFSEVLPVYLALCFVGPLVIVVVGSYLLTRDIRVLGYLESRLLGVIGDQTGRFSLDPIMNSSQPLVLAWNKLAEKMAHQESLQVLEERVCGEINSSHDQLSTQALENLSEGIVVTNDEGMIQYANLSFGAILNVELPEEVKTKTLAEILPDELYERIPELEQMIKANRPMNFEIALGDQTSDGVVSIKTRPIVNRDRMLLWHFSDVTQNKLADEMRDQFLSSATHELRTPLANIKAYAETLQTADDMDVEDHKNFCNIINSEATRLARLVDSLLDIKQIEAGSLSITRNETDLLRLIEEVCENVKPQMEQKQIAFELNVPPKLSKISVDKDKIVASLVNLLGNAAKYTMEGGKVLFRVEQVGSSMHFHIEDSGIGIRDEEISRIFEQFFRSSDPRVRDIPGNGIGLAYTSEVIELHGGQILIQSEIDKGTQFTVQLPMQ